MFFKYIIIALLCYVSLYSAELNGLVVDKSSDEEIPLIGAKVFWQNTEIGTITDDNGEFSIPVVEQSHMLVISYLGYEDKVVHHEHDVDFIKIELVSNLKTEQVNVEAKAPTRAIDRSNIVQNETITAQGLRKAACCNLSESFETNPSVDVNFQDAVTGIKQIQLLGLDGTYSQILYEKIPLNKGLAADIGFSHVPGPWLESIQISKGAASVQNGYESITGQININYKQPFESEKLYLNSYANNQQRFELNANSKYEFSDDLASMLFLHASQNMFEMDQNNDGFMDAPNYQFVNLLNRWEYRKGGYETKFGVKVLNEDRNSGQLGSSDETRTDLYGIQVNTNRIEAFAKNGYVFDTERYYSLGWITNYSRHDMNTHFGNRNYDGLQNSFYTNLILSTESDVDNHGHVAHKWNIGLSYRYDDFQEAAFDSTINRTELIPGAFLEYTYLGIENLTLQGGLRLDQHNLFNTFITPRVHAKYNLSSFTVLRASAGKGYKVNNIYAENMGFIASNRSFNVMGQLDPEEAWNFGLNFSSEFFFLNQLFTFNIDAYRTDFVNQVVVDIDASPNEVNFYNLNGESFSNSIQVDISFEPFYNLEFLLAYKFNEVMQNINGNLRERPLISKHKAFANVMYTTEDDKWVFDLTGIYNGSGRLPDTQQNPAEFQLADRFDPFFLMMGQVSRKFKNLEIYIGSENLTNFTQPNPIMAAQDPFGENFDTSFVYGPIAQRMIYAGARWSLD